MAVSVGHRGRFAGGPVRAVLFDYGDTLVTFERPEAALARARSEAALLLAERLGLDAVEAERTVADAAALVEEMVAVHEASSPLAEIDVAAVHVAAYASLGIDLSPDLLDRVQALEQRAWWAGVRVAPGAVSTLERLRAAGLRLGLCSNAPYHPPSLLGQLEHVGLRPLFDAVTFSSAVGWRKPSPRIFSAALAALGVAAEETVMVGDRLREDIAGAQALGMRAIWVREHRVEESDPGTPDGILDRLADLPLLLGLERRSMPS